MLQEENIEQKFSRLVQIMDELREQCPWDKKQTIHSLRPLTIEETYELGGAIIDNDWQEIKEELGDIMLHLLFYARLGKEENKFTLGDVLEGISGKMILRHPHIYGDVQVKDEEEVKKNWQKIKLQKEGRKSILGGVPTALPSVVKATRIQEKTKQVGFEWKNKEDVWKKVEEEIAELQEAITEKDQTHMEEELGDVLFSLVNYARFIHVDAETALEKTNKKFIRRFNQMEAIAEKEGFDMTDMTLEEMDGLWQKVKKGE